MDTSSYISVATLIITVVGWYIVYKLQVNSSKKQLNHQLKQELRLEGWKEIQKHLFDYSQKLSDAYTLLNAIKMVLTSDSNLARLEIRDFWDKKTDPLQTAYVNISKSSQNLSNSYKNYEVLFSALDKAFIDFGKFDDKLSDKLMAFSGEFIFFSFAYNKDNFISNQAKFEEDRTKMVKFIDENLAIHDNVAKHMDKFRKNIQKHTFADII